MKQENTGGGKVNEQKGEGISSEIVRGGNDKVAFSMQDNGHEVGLD